MVAIYVWSTILGVGCHVYVFTMEKWERKGNGNKNENGKETYVRFGSSDQKEKRKKNFFFDLGRSFWGHLS